MGPDVVIPFSAGGPAAATRRVRSAPPLGTDLGGPPAVETPCASERLIHLDALRGLAAVIVVAHHVLLAVSGGGFQAPWWGVFNIVLLGRPAVILFFVLSGFVLTLHLNAAAEGYLGYAVRRLVRLLVPYAAVVGIAAVACAGLRHPPPTGLSGWFDAQWSEPVDARVVFRHLALLAGPRQFPLDHVAWSLVHELRLSLALPVFLMALRRYGTGVALAAACGITGAAEIAVAARPGLFPAGVHGLRFDAESTFPSLVLTARFSLAFALGAVLATDEARMRAAMRRPGVALPTLAIGLIMLSGRNEEAMALGAVALVATAAWAPRLADALRLRPLLWLGRISFSLYLVHLPVMLACVHAGRGVVPAWLSLLGGVGLSFPVATLLAHRVEEPAIRWSRAAARIVSRRGGRPGRLRDRHRRIQRILTLSGLRIAQSDRHG